MFAPDGDINQETLWKDVNPENLMDSKLKCVFECAVEVTQNNVEPSAEEKNHAPKILEAPKLSPKSNNVENELRKTAEDLRRMEKENATLRQDNIQLKEDGLRLRRQQAEIQGSSGFGSDTLASPSITSTLQTFQSNSSNQPPLFVLLLVAVASAVVGLILGKIF